MRVLQRIWSVLACEDLILNKLIAGRVLDRADVGALLRANVGTLDLAYLLECATMLGLTDDLALIWAAALPAQRFPTAAG